MKEKAGKRLKKTKASKEKMEMNKMIKMKREKWTWKNEKGKCKWKKT